jgi:hypothetical protein
MSNRILERFGVPYTVTRQKPGAPDQAFDLNGTYQGRAQTGTITFTAQMSVQPLRGRDREFLPEGMREKEVVCALSDTQLNVADQKIATQGDRFDWNGRTYECGHREIPDGSFRMDINYWEGYAFLVEQDTQP